MRRTVITTLVVALLFAGASTARAGDRLNDSQLTQLVATIDTGFDRWKQDLERRNVDDGRLTNAQGVVDVRKFLNDLERDIHLVKDRLKPSYAANPEVTALLRRASDVERRYRSGTAQAPEAWKTMSNQLASLAAAYGVGWPLDDTANAVRRMDGELGAEAKKLAEASDRLRSAAMKAASDAKKPQAERDAFDQQMKELKKAAEQLASSLKDHRAVQSEVTRVLELNSKAAVFANGAGTMKPEGSAALLAMNACATILATSFGVPKP